MHCAMTLFFSACNQNKIYSRKGWQVEHKAVVFRYQNQALAALLFVDNPPNKKKKPNSIIKLISQKGMSKKGLRDSIQYCFWTPNWVGVQRWFHTSSTRALDDTDSIFKSNKTTCLLRPIQTTRNSMRLPCQLTYGHFKEQISNF